MLGEEMFVPCLYYSSVGDSCHVEKESRKAYQERRRRAIIKAHWEK